MKTMYCHIFLFLKKIVADKKNMLVLLAFLFTANISIAQPAPMDQTAADSLNKLQKAILRIQTRYMPFTGLAVAPHLAIQTNL